MQAILYTTVEGEGKSTHLSIWYKAELTLNGPGANNSPQSTRELSPLNGLTARPLLLVLLLLLTTQLSERKEACRQVANVHCLQLTNTLAGPLLLLLLHVEHILVIDPAVCHWWGSTWPLNKWQVEFAKKKKRNLPKQNRSKLVLLFLLLMW